jgi:hypothetical protein
MMRSDVFGQKQMDDQRLLTLSASNALVASSKIMTAGFATSTRALGKKQQSD